MACNMSKSKSMMQMMKYTLPDSELYPKSKKIQELLKTLAHRDAEIRKFCIPNSKCLGMINLLFNIYYNRNSNENAPTRER